MVKIGPVIEIILNVQDMDAQVSFYRDTLSLAVSYPLGVNEYSDQMWVTFDTGVCTLALHGGGKGRLGQDAPKFVFKVEDVAGVRKKLLALDVPMGEIRSAAPGVLVCDGKDPEGNPFSIESQAER